MELKEFVTKSILDICEGIKEAQKQGEAYGLFVAPPVNNDGILAKVTGHEVPSYLRFNVKVTVEDKNVAGDGGGAMALKMAGFEVNLSKDKKKEEATSACAYQELKFDIPVIWPTNFKQQDLSNISSPNNRCDYDPLKY